MRLALALLVVSAAYAEDLSEWIVDTPGVWSIKDGVISGRHEGLKYNDFLRTKANYSDFELEVEFLLVNGVGNSGIQFRSKPMPDSHEVIGYQADIGQQYWGCLYDESRRKRVLMEARPEATATLNKSGWNRYKVRAQGNRITLEVNGVVSVDYTEAESGIEREGFIALQVHSGPATEVRFRNLKIRRL